MKTIKTLIEIPAKFKWIAQDLCGEWWIYTRKPEIINGVTWNTPMLSTDTRKELFCGNKNPDWKNTLQRIHEYEDLSDD